MNYTLNVLIFVKIYFGLLELVFGLPFDGKWPSLSSFKHHTGKIVGGEEAVPHSVPYQAELEIYDGFIFSHCGGVLIAPGWILTVAHCGRESHDITVTLGAHNLSDANEPNQVNVKAAANFLHPDWNEANFQNDIALIRLAHNVELNHDVNVISLPKWSDADKDFAGQNGTLTGWGITATGGTELPDNLQTVTLEIITNDDCKKAFEPMNAPIESYHICVNGSLHQGGCNGDSGGPLVVVDENGDRTLVGLVEFGLTDCQAGFPTVFTRTTYYLDWISSTSGIEIKP